MLQETIGKLKEAIKDSIHEVKWRRACRHFGQKLEELSHIVEAFDLGVDIQEFSRICQQIYHRPKRRDESHRTMDATRGSVEREDRHDEREEDA